MSRVEYRVSLLLLFCSAYLVALLVCPAFNEQLHWPHGARLVLLLCGAVGFGAVAALIGSFASEQAGVALDEGADLDEEDEDLDVPEVVYALPGVA